MIVHNFSPILVDLGLFQIRWYSLAYILGIIFGWIYAIYIINKTKKNDQLRVIEFDDIKIDLNKQMIIKKDNEYKINNTEKVILEKMINSPGKTFSREDIGELINLDKERSIDVIITRLRKKIETNPKNPKFLQTIRGAGYVLWIK